MVAEAERGESIGKGRPDWTCSLITDREKDAVTTLRKEGGRYNVLAMDGGGFYGVFTALLLRELHKRNSKFLNGDNPILFAGTSAGALNALLLAKHEKPNVAIQDDTLIEFFMDQRVYSNSLNPLGFGLLTSICGGGDFHSLLTQHFDDRTMSDLKQRVLITAFDLWGERDERPPHQQRWKPKVFYNYPDDEPDRRWYVRDVAYGAASPPTVRPIVNGITDGGFFADDPSVSAIAKIVSEIRENKKGRKDNSEQGPGLEEVMKNIRVLSLGAGAMTPHYFLNTFNLGLLPFNLLPTNLGQWSWESPLTTFTLNPDKRATEYEAKQLLGPEYYFRLDPPVLRTSVASASYFSGIPLYREFLLATMDRIANSPIVQDQIEEATDWIQEHEWGK